MIETKRSSRIGKLREYYLNNSPMSINKKLVCWKCHRSLMLYNEGWEKSAWSADTVRLRRSAAEAYLLENTRPSIIPRELIVGQPDLSDFSDDEEEVIETGKAHDSKKSFGAIQRKSKPKDSLENDEVADAWAKRYGGAK